MKINKDNPCFQQEQYPLCPGKILLTYSVQWCFPDWVKAVDDWPTPARLLHLQLAVSQLTRFDAAAANILNSLSEIHFAMMPGRAALQMSDVQMHCLCKPWAAGSIYWLLCMPEVRSSQATKGC